MKKTLLFLLILLTLLFTGVAGPWFTAETCARYEKPGPVLPGQRNKKKSQKTSFDTKTKLNTKEGNEKTALMLAARDYGIASVKSLLDEGAEVNVQDENGWTPLMYAAKNNSARVVKTLLDAGAKLNDQNKHGWTPLMYATYYNEPGVVKILLEAGAKVDIEEHKYGVTASDIAYKRNNEEILKHYRVITGEDIQLPGRGFEPYEYIAAGASRWTYKNDKLQISTTGRQFNSGVFLNNIGLEAQFVSGTDGSIGDTTIELDSAINLRVMPAIKLKNKDYAWLYGSIGISHTHIKTDPSDPTAEKISQRKTDMSYGVGGMFGTENSGVKLDWTYYNKERNFNFYGFSISCFLTF